MSTNILDLIIGIGLHPKWEARTGQGEFSSACPWCDGDDRFLIWPNEGATGRYWCRQCGAKGDGIGFCMKYHHMSYVEACEGVGAEPRRYGAGFDWQYRAPPKKESLPPPELWQLKAEAFVDWAHKNLVSNVAEIDRLGQQRGINLESIVKWRLGWNHKYLARSGSAWGLSGTRSKICLPKGIVIPRLDGKPIQGVRIRCADESKGKYCTVTGGINGPTLCGDLSKPILVLESELDAVLVLQEAGDLVCCLALGCVNATPTPKQQSLLHREPFLLSLDYDDAGWKGREKWEANYPNTAVVWFSGRGKSPGDLRGAEVRIWIEGGLNSERFRKTPI